VVARTSQGPSFSASGNIARGSTEAVENHAAGSQPPWPQAAGGQAATASATAPQEINHRSRGAKARIPETPGDAAGGRTVAAGAARCQTDCRPGQAGASGRRADRLGSTLGTARENRRRHEYRGAAGDAARASAKRGGRDRSDGGIRHLRHAVAFLRWRQHRLPTVATPAVQADWDIFRADMQRQTGYDGPVQRKAPKSPEPPELVWLRDYPGLASAAWIVFVGVLAGFLGIAAIGSGTRRASPTVRPDSPSGSAIPQSATQHGAARQSHDEEQDDGDAEHAKQ